MVGPPEINQFGFNRHIMGHFDPQQSFKGLHVRSARKVQTLQKIIERALIANIIDGSLRSDGRTARKNQYPVRMVQTGHQGNEGIVRILYAGFRSGRIYASFAGSWMKIGNDFVPVILSRRHTAENKLLGGWNLPECEVLRWRAHEDKIIVTSFVEREEASRLDTEMASGFLEQAVQFQNSQQFADSGVVLVDLIARVSGRYEIAEPSLRISDKNRIAENDNGFLRSMEEWVPESLKRHWRWACCRLPDDRFCCPVMDDINHGSAGQQHDR